MSLDKVLVAPVEILAAIDVLVFFFFLRTIFKKKANETEATREAEATSRKTEATIHPMMS